MTNIMPHKEETDILMPNKKDTKAMRSYHEHGHKRYKTLCDELILEVHKVEDQFKNYRESTEHVENWLKRDNARLTYYMLVIKDIVRDGEEEDLPAVFAEMDEEANDEKMPWEKVLDNYIEARVK